MNMCQKPYRTNRNRDYYRHHRERVINRKVDIQLDVYGNVTFTKHLGQLSKGKIHCSCNMCAEKTKVWGYKAKEQKVIDHMEKDIQEFFDKGLE